MNTIGSTEFPESNGQENSVLTLKRLAAVTALSLAALSGCADAKEATPIDGSLPGCQFDLADTGMKDRVTDVVDLEFGDRDSNTVVLHSESPSLGARVVYADGQDHDLEGSFLSGTADSLTMSPDTSAVLVANTQDGGPESQAYHCAKGATYSPENPTG